METDRKQNEALEAFFEAARSEGDVSSPSPALMARILEDAEAQRFARVQAENKPVSRVAPARPGLFSGLMEALGGWPSLAGLTAATLAGLWIGYSPPTGIDSLSQTLLQLDDGSGYSDVLASYDAFLADG